MKIDKKTIIRTAILFVALVNATLSMFGIKTLPIDNEMISEAVSVAILIASSVSAWWKNNSFTKKAIMADDYMKSLNEGE